MTRSLAILAVLCLFVSAGVAEDLMVTRFVCDRDNANDTTNDMANYGSDCTIRWAKNKQEATHYADWSESDLQELKEAMAAPPPAGYTHLVARYALTAPDWAAPSPSVVVWFSAFSSGNDWYANESCQDLGRMDDYGACDEYADSVPTPEIRWTVPGTGAPVNFWGLPELANSIPFVGYAPTVPVNFGNLKCDIDPAVLTALIDDPMVRGLRCWDEGWTNAQVYARGQWGCPGAAAAIEVWAIPEPATMLLLGIGGVGLLLRKRR